MINIYEEIGLAPVINADGRMTALGVSVISDQIAETMKKAAQSYVVIDDLYKMIGKKIAELVKVPDVCPVISASSGITLSVASLICGDDIAKVKTFTKTVENAKKREVIILKGQNIDFGAPIQLIVEMGGGKVVEVGFANFSSKTDVINAINENTLALLFVQSHHCVQKNMLTAQELIDIGKENNIPIILDASAEEDLFKYAKMGADFICYSGSKAISGCTSGFVECSSVKYADAMRLQYKGIGRAMKLGKENCLGLYESVKTYVKNNGYIPIVKLDDLEAFNKKINKIAGLSSKIVKDEAGREIYRSQITVNTAKFGIDAVELNMRLRKFDPKIFLRDHQAKIGLLAVDPRPLRSAKDLDIIFEAIKSIR